MDGLTYSSHFALSFSSGILFKNIFIRVTKLPVFKLLPTEKQLFHGYNNLSEIHVFINYSSSPPSSILRINLMSSLPVGNC